MFDAVLKMAIVSGIEEVSGGQRRTLWPGPGPGILDHSKEFGF